MPFLSTLGGGSVKSYQKLGAASQEFSASGGSLIQTETINGEDYKVHYFYHTGTGPATTEYTDG